ncbi:MAG: hypothetical protein JOY78_12725 [Pseudonocardia sp.]|nr:hypothetical protein [Pseudonocardia sp.]
MAQRLYPRLRADELLRADGGFYSWQAWDTAAATGAALLWRPPTQLELLRGLGRVLRSRLPDLVLLVFVDQSAEPVVSSDVVDRGSGAAGGVAVGERPGRGCGAAGGRCNDAQTYAARLRRVVD